MPIRSQITSIMGQIEPEHLELFTLEFGKIAESGFVYTLSIYKYQPISTKLSQNVYDQEISDDFNYGTNRTKNIWSYLPLNLEKLLNLALFTLLASTNINQSAPISDHKISDEFDYGFNQTRTVRVICP